MKNHLVAACFNVCRIQHSRINQTSFLRCEPHRQTTDVVPKYTMEARQYLRLLVQTRELSVTRTYEDIGDHAFAIGFRKKFQIIKNLLMKKICERLGNFRIMLQLQCSKNEVLQIVPVDEPMDVLLCFLRIVDFPDNSLHEDIMNVILHTFPSHAGLIVDVSFANDFLWICNLPIPNVYAKRS